MAAKYLEIAKTSDRGTRTLVRMCHNFKNIVLVKESFDDKPQLWHTKNSFLFQLNTLKQYLNTQNRTIYFNLQKRQKKSLRQEESLHILIDIMDVLLPFKQKSRM